MDCPTTRVFILFLFPPRGVIAQVPTLVCMLQFFEAHDNVPFAAEGWGRKDESATPLCTSTGPP